MKNSQLQGVRCFHTLYMYILWNDSHTILAFTLAIKYAISIFRKNETQFRVCQYDLSV